MTTWATVSKKKILPREDLPNKLQELKQSGRTIATTNGAFDLLHSGHLQIIYEASKQADVLIVALNSDLSIKKYKDISRPIISLQYRLEMISALEFVSFVTWFDETNPIALLELIQPHVHINGREYGENCIEADIVKKYGGRIHITDIIPGFSTSKIIDKIKVCV